ncbi:MAG: hypothetical protein AAF685_10095 [Cyanobacteria bacterium P01_C01_bin.89]
MDNSQQRFSTGFFSASQPNPSADDTPPKAADATINVDGVDVDGVDTERYSVDPSAAEAGSSDENIAPEASAHLAPVANLDEGLNVADPSATDKASSEPQSSPVAPASVVPSAASADSASPSLPRFSGESAAESSAPPQNWSLSSGFWQAAERSPALENMSPQNSPDHQDSPNQGSRPQEQKDEVAERGEHLNVSDPAPEPNSEDLQQHSKPVAIALEPVQPSQPAQNSSQNLSSQSSSSQNLPGPNSDETLHQPNAELAQLRAENQQLYEHIAQMEMLLQECQATLELQMMRSQTQESLIERQTQELEETHQALQQTQAEANRILTELEKSGRILHHQAQELADAQQLGAELQGALDQTQQEVSRYQVVVETLTQELDSSQTRIAHLEETCAQLQQRSLSQDTAIAQTEADCQELQSRLNRQQRQTLHFRAALERCLGMNLATELELQGSGTIQPWSLGDSAPQSNEAHQGTSPSVAAVQNAPIGDNTTQQYTIQQDHTPLDQPQQPQEIYPSIPMAPLASTPITLPPLGEIPDAEIDEPVEVSPSDIVALLDWNLEASPEPRGEAAIAAADLEGAIEGEMEDADIENASIEDIGINEAHINEAHGEILSDEGAIAQPSSPVEPPAIDMPFAKVPPNIQQPPPREENLEPAAPEPLKQPLANLLSLGAELLNLQGISTPHLSQEASPQDQSLEPPVDGAPEPETQEPQNIAREKLSFSLEDSDINESETRHSLSSIDLPHFSQP